MDINALSQVPGLSVKPATYVPPRALRNIQLAGERAELRSELR